MTDRDHTLIESFENLTLPLAEWHQRTHVALAYLYLRAQGFEAALERLRRGIKAFNAHHGIEESPTSGYNETTTVAFLRLIQRVDHAYDSVFPSHSAQDFCDTHPQLLSKHVLRFFYSPARRLHPEAKTRFIEPDLTPLPAPP